MKARTTIAIVVSAAAIAGCAFAAVRWRRGAQASPALPPVSRTVFLDPFAMAYQTDDPKAGAALSSEPGYWPVPNGLADPLADWKRISPRVIHTVFRVSESPFPDYNPENPSPLFKVNQVGYMPNAPKYIYVGAWLGPKFGPWRPHAPMDAWELVDSRTGETVFSGTGANAPRRRIADPVSKEGIPFTGEETWELDFSQFTREGTYFARIEGVGRSMDFRISSRAAEEAFRVHMGGLYQKRCGIAKEEPFTHWTAGACHTNVVRGTFPPEEGTLSPKVSWFELVRYGTDWGHGERLHVSGGWHDAADYDRRPQHLSIVNDLCAVYLMRPGNFSDGQLSIPENSNGIPDILDEAEWGLRHLLAVQQPDGGVGTWIETIAHPGPGNLAEKDRFHYAVSRATRKSSLAFAAHAALLARCHPAFRDKYLQPALDAWDFAIRSEQQSDMYEVTYRRNRFSTGTEIVYWEEDADVPAELLLKAALNLGALTGSDSYLESVQAKVDNLPDKLARDSWRLEPLFFAGEMALGVSGRASDILGPWRNGKLKAAESMLAALDSAYPYRNPWRTPDDGWVHTMGMGHAHPLVRARTLVLAHYLTGDRRFLDAISLANDFHCGCNPQGATLTSGLGVVYPIAFLDLPSYSDGIAEYVPGISPYRWTYAMPGKAVGLVWGGDRKWASHWPIWRRWGNLEGQTVAASEYTVWETIAPAAAVTGYLLEPSGEPPRPGRLPAESLRDLAGYWPLP